MRAFPKWWQIYKQRLNINSVPIYGLSSNKVSIVEGGTLKSTLYSKQNIQP